MTATGLRKQMVGVSQRNRARSSSPRALCPRQVQATCELSVACRRVRSHGQVIRAHTMRTIVISASR